MKKKYVFFYFMKKEPEKINKVVPSHIHYWKSLNLLNHTGGPFADRSGGLITFEADDIEEATMAAMKDPFISEDLLENFWVKEWNTE